MSTDLKIGKRIDGQPFNLPLELVTQSVAILAKKRTGKSYTAAVIAEELLRAGQQVVIIDPTGAHWGLRSSDDGKSAGHPIVVFGGDHADVPLEEGAGEIIARAVVEQRFSAILDLSLLRKNETTRFLAIFLETLYRLNRSSPICIICDEADAYAPQRDRPEVARTLGAMEDLVRRGGIRGIGTILITQRPAVLNKNVLTQCETLVALRIVHPKDIAAIKEWVDVHGDPAKAQTMIQSLPALPIGTAWFWSPGWGDLFDRVQVRRRRTFDSGATPKPGQTIRAPTVLAPVDVNKLGEAIKATAAKAAADDPRALRRTIAELQAQLKAAGGAGAPAAKEAIAAAYREGIEAGRNQLQADLTRVEARLHIAGLRLTEYVGAITAARELLAHVWKFEPRTGDPVPAQRPAVRPPAPALPPPPKPARATTETGQVDVSRNSGRRRMLIAMAQNPNGLTATKLSLLTGISQSGGTWRTYLGELRSAGYVDGLCITPAGVHALGSYDPLPTGRELIEFWRQRLGDSGKRRIFDLLVTAYPHAMPKERVSEETRIDMGGGTWRTYLGELRGLELIEGSADLRASADLFGFE